MPRKCLATAHQMLKECLQKHLEKLHIWKSWILPSHQRMKNGVVYTSSWLTSAKVKRKLSISATKSSFMRLCLLFLGYPFLRTEYSVSQLRPGSSATGMGQFPICKLKRDFLRTSVRACTIDKITFSAPFGIFHMRTEMCKDIFQKKSSTTP